MFQNNDGTAQKPKTERQWLESTPVGARIKSYESLVNPGSWRRLTYIEITVYLMKKC